MACRDCLRVIRKKYVKLIPYPLLALFKESCPGSKDSRFKIGTGTMTELY